MHKVELLTRDGVRYRFEAEPEDLLIDAAAKAGIYPPAGCRSGSCGACHVQCVEGRVDMQGYAEAALCAEERAEGGILLCRAHARGDLQLHAPFGSDCVSSMPVPRRYARLTGLEPAGARTVWLSLQYEDDPQWGSGADFIPGQFVELTVPGTEVSRAYSIANTPNWDGHLEFYVRLQPAGVFSAYLQERARLGDRLAVRGPQGCMTIDEKSLAPRWFVAGGTGIAPMLSMLGHMAALGDARACRLIFGANCEDELFAQERIARIQESLATLHTTVCLWKPARAWDGFTGTPADALAQSLPGARPLPDIYVCGPAPLVDAVIHQARCTGIHSDRVFSERCVPSGK